MVSAKQTSFSNRSPDPRLELRFVVYPHHKAWIAHCLEMDVVSDASTPREAVASLIQLCDLQISAAMDDGDLPSIFRPAPAEFWHMFAVASRIRGAKPALDRIDRLEVRELAPR